MAMLRYSIGGRTQGETTAEQKGERRDIEVRTNLYRLPSEETLTDAKLNEFIIGIPESAH